MNVRDATPRPRLVATDLDGTVVPWDAPMTERTVATLRAVEAAGVPVVFVTGRPVRWMSEVAQRTGHTGQAICANGAVLYDLHDERMVEHFPLAVEAGLDVARRLRRALPDITFALETMDGFAREPAYVARWDRGSDVATGPLESLYRAPALKLLARHEDLDPDRLLAAAQEAAGDLAELTHSSTSGLLEISAAGVSKASTLALLCERSGIEAADVVAFGDMPNDLTMLTWAGTAYAVEGGHPDVIDAVGRTVPPPEEDGVARELERIFGLAPQRP